jgi:hypothetical protein
MVAAWKRRDPGIAERLDAVTPRGRSAEPSEIAEAQANFIARVVGGRW